MMNTVTVAELDVAYMVNDLMGSKTAFSMNPSVKDRILSMSARALLDVSFVYSSTFFKEADRVAEAMDDIMADFEMIRTATQRAAYTKSLRDALHAASSPIEEDPAVVSLIESLSKDEVRSGIEGFFEDCFQWSMNIQTETFFDHLDIFMARFKPVAQTA